MQRFGLHLRGPKEWQFMPLCQLYLKNNRTLSRHVPVVLLWSWKSQVRWGNSHICVQDGPGAASQIDFNIGSPDYDAYRFQLDNDT